MLLDCPWNYCGSYLLGETVGRNLLGICDGAKVDV